LLFVTEGANVTLAKAMPRVVKAIRSVLGDRSFTAIFDRGGHDGKRFGWLKTEKIDFITYQQGDPALPTERSSRHATKFAGKIARFWTAEGQVLIAKSWPWRRIVVRAKNGHQTPILTTLTELPAGAADHRNSPAAGAAGGVGSSLGHGSGQPHQWRKTRNGDGLLGRAEVGKDRSSRPGVTYGHSVGTVWTRRSGSFWSSTAVMR